jgi:hypothetical protein
MGVGDPIGLYIFYIFGIAAIAMFIYGLRYEKRSSMGSAKEVPAPPPRNKSQELIDRNRDII